MNALVRTRLRFVLAFIATFCIYAAGNVLLISLTPPTEPRLIIVASALFAALNCWWFVRLCVARNIARDALARDPRRLT